MSDTLIRGMEMPKEGGKILISADGSVWVNAWPARGYLRMENAYAIPLPEGHGELIERKRLDLVPDYKNVRNGIKHIVKETKRHGSDIAGISIELLEQTLVALDELRSVRRYFENAKTIVPAEGGGEADKKTNCFDCGNRNTPVCKYCEHDAEGGNEDG